MRDSRDNLKVAKAIEEYRLLLRQFPDSPRAPEAAKRLRELTEEELASTGMSLVYKQWLSQDVVWIIGPDERDAFLHLTNDQERDRFIEQFWERRNPPSAPANAYREQHYARIAYANEHFGATGVAGWMTDRGRTYILYGNPELVDSHPSGGQIQAYQLVKLKTLAL